MSSLATLVAIVAGVVAVVYAVVEAASDLRGAVAWVGECLTSKAIAVATVVFLVGVLFALHAHFETESLGWTVVWSTVAAVGAILVVVVDAGRR